MLVLVFFVCLFFCHYTVAHKITENNFICFLFPFYFRFSLSSYCYLLPVGFQCNDVLNNHVAFRLVTQKKKKHYLAVQYKQMQYSEDCNSAAAR